MSPQRQQRGTPQQEDMIAVHDLTMDTIANNRRSKSRGAMIQTHGENLELQRQAAQLAEENEELRETIQAVSSLVRTNLINSDALKKTIAHLRSAWQEESPSSEARQQIDEGLDNFYNEAYDANSADPRFGETASQRVEQAKNKAKQQSKARRPR